MTKLFAVALGIAPMFVAGTASAQNGMMNGGMGIGGWMGDYEGYALPVLLVVAVCLLVWVIMQKRK